MLLILRSPKTSHPYDRALYRSDSQLSLEHQTSHQSSCPPYHRRYRINIRHTVSLNFERTELNVEVMLTRCHLGGVRHQLVPNRSYFPSIEPIILNQHTSCEKTTTSPMQACNKMHQNVSE